MYMVCFCARRFIVIVVGVVLVLLLMFVLGVVVIDYLGLIGLLFGLLYYGVVVCLVIGGEEG